MGRSKRKRSAARPVERVEVANAAPMVAGSAPLETSAEALRMTRQNRHNPMPSLSPRMLSQVLDRLAYGHLRDFALLAETAAERDDTLPGVKGKREKDVSQLDRQITLLDDSDEAKAHQEVLEDFWNNVRATNTYDRNEKGGFKRLVKQMMQATSFRYHAHHIVWSVKADGALRATFESVPLWMFENTTGTLRYLPKPGATYGEVLSAGDWMVTYGDGLMISCLIGYLAKKGAFNDLLIFSEKFSVPGILGRTSAKQGTPEGNAMRDAVAGFGHDWMGVIYGDDGSQKEPIQIVQAAGNPAAMPMPAVVNMVNEKFAQLYRGGDLSTQSSKDGGEGRGASLQGGEADILKKDDAETIAETLEDVSRRVIEWHFGDGTEPLARVELVVEDGSDESSLVGEALQIADRGGKVSVGGLMKRRKIPMAEDAEDTLGKAENPESRVQNPETSARRSEGEPGAEEDARRLGSRNTRGAVAEDLTPIYAEMDRISRIADAEEFYSELADLSERLPELLGDSDALAAEMIDEMLAAFSGKKKTKDEKPKD